MISGNAGPLLAITTVSVLASVALILLKTENKNKNKIKRRWWVRPMLLQRKAKGHFHNLFAFMKNNDPDQFFIYTRMSVAHFNVLLELLEEALSKKSIREPLSPEHRLCLTLYYLAHGGSMQAAAWSFYVSKSTVSAVVKDTCSIMWEVLSPIYLSAPTTEDWERIAQQFDATWNMPNCIGAIDGNHIVIQAPYNSGSTYFNYKKTFSIVLMAMCDANYKFTLVDVGAYGSQSDGGVFRESSYGMGLDNNTLGVPVASRLPGVDTNFPYYVVGDEAFPLKSYIMRPYPGKNLNKNQLIFNYRLSRARRVIENAFGIMTSRWRIFRSSIIASPSTAEAIVCTAMCLHNFLRDAELSGRPEDAVYCPERYADRWDRHGNLIPAEWRDGQHLILQRLGQLGSNNAPRNSINLRNTLADYLASPEGAVPWQDTYVSRGSF